MIIFIASTYDSNCYLLTPQSNPFEKKMVTFFGNKQILVYDLFIFNLLIILMKKILFLFLLGFFCYPRAQNAPATIYLQDNWQVISANDLQENQAALISLNDDDAYPWYPSKVPSTVLNTLVQNGVYKNILEEMNLKDIPEEQFNVPWWYRTSFQLESIPANAQLDLNGINYQADIWLNGKQVASNQEINGMFKRFELDITPFLQKGKNILTIKVYPPQADDFRIGFTDWNPNPPDKNMGLYRNVQIRLNQGLELKNLYVQTELDSPKNTQAELTLQALAINHLDTAIDSHVVFKIDSSIEISHPVHLDPHESKIITITPLEEEQLIISQPKLWWPHPMGDPYLYHLTGNIYNGNQLSDSQNIHFGIRKIETYVEPYQENQLSYYRGFKINGQKILIRGAAWTDSILLNDTPKQVQDQIRYVKDMHLNAIRLEGFWGNDKTLYETCDKEGILIMIGWSAQWDWPLRGFRKASACDSVHGCYLTAKDEDLIVESYKHQILWLRNSPSVFVWMLGSDLKPKPQLEKRLAELLTKENKGVPYVISAADTFSELDKQPSGMKMRGPYIYVPPVYWFSNVTDGGAFGFNTETGPGSEVPPLESLQKLLGDPKNAWPNSNQVWIYHLGDHPKLQTLTRNDEAMALRYGEATDLEDYAKKSQLMNYESIRPMFEAFRAYQSGNPYINQIPATGVFQWMLNAAWPKFFWQLYDYYLVPGGAYFSAKKANQPLHVIFNYANKSLYLSNTTQKTAPNLTVKARIWDTNSQMLKEYEWGTSLAANQSQLLQALDLPKIETQVYFVELTLQNEKQHTLDHSIYWLSQKEDILGSDTTILQQANFYELNHLPQATLNVKYAFTQEEHSTLLTVKLENTSDKISFFNRLNIKTEKKAIISPVIWSDNFITIFPHQTEEITARIAKDTNNEESFIFVIDGWNTKYNKTLLK